MARQFKLLKDWPGVLAGAILAQQADGRYQGDGVWADRTIVEDNPEGFLEQPQWSPAVGETYYYIDDTGVIRQATYQDLLLHRARVTFGNYFKTAELAQPVRNRMMLAFHAGINHGVA